MATNVVNDSGATIRKKMTVGASQVKNSVILLNEMPVFLLEDADSSNKATCVLPGTMVVDLAVVGANGAGNIAVAVGHRIYKDGTEYNRDSTNGTLFGYALGAVNSGATTTIPVLMFA
ncbi:MAG: hypothetical protein F9K46_04065 [Anaerolineae bacterium]|nr:MAG: hypothetical protein F9K46_04065 [Anaerolineae bacterium]